MLLPLAFLGAPRRYGRTSCMARAGSLTTCSRAWRTVAPSAEGFGPAGLAYFPAASSNEAYGTSEFSVVQQEGDTACDLLYTMNFAFIGLHEAARATGETKYRVAEDRIAEFALPDPKAALRHTPISTGAGCVVSITAAGNTGAAPRTPAGGRGALRPAGRNTWDRQHLRHASTRGKGFSISRLPSGCNGSHRV